MLVATIVPALMLSCGLAARPEPYLPDCKLTPTPRLIAPATSSPYLATSRPFTAGVDDSRRPGFGGRAWSDRGEVGGRLPDEINAASNPGPGAYGAYENDDTLIHVRLSSGYVMTISPWQAIDPSEVSFDRLDVATRDWFREHGTTNKEVWTELEEGRQAWLRERGYTYSVRTFSGSGAAEDQTRVDVSDIKPVMTLDRPTDEPKFRKKMQVRNQPQAQPAQDRELAAIGREMVKGNARVSMPPLADREAVKQSLARAEASKNGETAKHEERGDEKASKVATR
ncbi:MAG TPA: hypothetical protein VF777_15665 [Phycisphaerales bacterium]